uniref:Ribosomal protein S14 n=1 Tax=Urostyla grandis TaxID=57509 RepID=A0A2I4PEK4_9SPIT|nr:ribosomal protein S14 [Urostyla grandis]
MKRQQAWLEFEMMRRLFFLKYEMRRRLLKTMINSSQIKHMPRLHAKYLFSRLPRLARLPQSHARCLVSGRARGVNTRYGMSRFAFRRLANGGNIANVSRGSW